MIEQCFMCKQLAETPLKLADAHFSDGEVVPVRVCIDCVEEMKQEIADACFEALVHSKVDFHGKRFTVTE